MHARADDLLDRGGQQREVRAAQHERVDAAALERVEVVARDLVERRAHEHVGRVGQQPLHRPVVEPQPLLDDVDEARSRRREDRHAGVERSDRADCRRRTRSCRRCR